MKRILQGALLLLACLSFTSQVHAQALAVASTSPLPPGDANSFYSFQFTASGVNGNSLTWSAPNGTPAGLTLDSVTGILSGTPPQAIANDVFTVRVDDTNGEQTASKTFSFTANSALVILTPSPLPSGTAFVNYSTQITGTGGMTPYQWSIVNSNVPGLSIDLNSGLLSGTPNGTGTFTFTIQLQDATQSIVTGQFQITINGQAGSGPQITSPPTLPNGEQNVAYTYALTASGGNGQFSWGLNEGSTLPAGLTLSQTGILFGPPTAAPGVYSFSVAVFSNDQGVSQTESLTIVSPVSISSSSPLPAGDSGSSYGFSFQASGGQTPYVWSLGSGSPAGLAINATTGLLSGIPSSSGAVGFGVTVSDALGGTNTKQFQLTISPALAITSPSPLPSAEASASYSDQLTGTGGSGTYTWSLSSGSTLPSGLTLSAGGMLGGTPATQENASFGITLNDTANGRVSKTFQLTIAAGPSITSSSPLTAGAVASQYSFPFQATGGSGSNAWSVTTGSLPSGLFLGASGTLSGTPTAAGTSNFTVRVQDSSGANSTKSFALTISSGLSISSVSPLPGGEVSRPYTFNFSGAGGSSPYTWSLSEGSSLPAVLTLNSAGLLSGRPTVAGSTSFSVQVTDAFGNTATKPFQLAIVGGPTITTGPSLPPGTLNGSYGSFTLTGSGGSTPYQWSNAQLPPGFSLTSGGVLSGTPTSAGVNNFSVTLTDALGGTASASFSVNVVAGLTITSTSPLTAGTVGSPYSFTFHASGGSGSYTWAIGSGTLPSGLSLNGSTGLLSGTPSGTGNFTFQVLVNDPQVEAPASQTFTLSIGSNFAITSAALPGGTVGASYSQQLATSGGTGSVTWSLASGALPAGTTLSASGMISGLTSTAGTFNFSVRATDSAMPADVATRAFAVVVIPVVAPLTITSPAPVTGQLGTTYSFTFTASGGTQPYSWSVAGGALPSGLTLIAPSGVLSGKATGVGPYSFTIQVTDASGTSATQPDQLQFALPAAPPLQITGIPLNPAPSTQPSFQITIPSSYSFDIQGILTLTFSSPSGINDPAIQFTNGTRNLPFTIPAGTTTAVYSTGNSPVFLTGTIAGTITLTVTQYQALGTSLTPVPPPVQVVIAPTAPVITSATATRGTGGFTVTVVGYSPTREVSGGTFSFLGSDLKTPQLSLNLSTLFQGWFGSTTSDQFGSQFSLTQPFNLQGGSGSVKYVSITLTNSIGTSQLVQVPVE